MTDPTTSHRLVNLRARSAGCSCGATYTGEGSADLREQHRQHKANPQPATKATTVKPRPRKAAAK